MRTSWDEYFLALAQAAASRATCPRRQVGCVLTCGNRIISTGFNGSAPGLPHCDEVGCLMHEDRCIRTIHAEANALAQARGQAVDTAYTTDEPCLPCAKLLMAAGIKRVIYQRAYPSVERDLWLNDIVAGDPGGVCLSWMLQLAGNLVLNI